MNDPFVEQLAGLCKAHVARAKWVFVPSHAIGRTLGERIALDGTNWLNLRFVTPLDVALRMGAPFLVERGIDPSEEGLGPALMMRLLLDLTPDGGYFRPLADQPTMAQALYATVRELRMAGVKSDGLKPDGFESPAKHRELSALLAAYEHYLLANNRGDMATVYEEAVLHPDWCPIQPEDCWTELPDTIWTPLQRRLIDALPGERIVPRALAIAGATVPRRLQGASVEWTQPDVERTPFALFHAGGREAEIEGVFRRILANKAPLDQVEIACAFDEHVALVWEKALRHEWPVTLGPGIPATSTRPGRALLGFCDWIESDFSAGHLRRLLQSGDMGIEQDDEGFTAGEAARTIVRAGAGWGRATYALSLGILRESYEARAKDPDLPDVDRDAARNSARLTKKVSAWITAIVAQVPEASSSGKVPLQKVVDAAVAFAEHSTSRTSALDHTSAAALVDYIGELRALGAFECSLEQALRFVRERVGSLQVAPDRPRPGHLYASRLQQAGYSGRPHLFVVGLEEGRVFPVASEDPVLLDCERAAISPALRLSSDRLDESVYAVLARLGTLGTGAPVVQAFRPATAQASASVAQASASVAQAFRPATAIGTSVAQAFRPAPAVTFSYSCRDTREFRETYASWLMLQAFRVQQGDETVSYPQMKAALGEPVSVLPASREAAATDAGWWLRSVAGTGDKGVEAVAATFVNVARGREAEALRASEKLTEFDGHVPAAGAHLDPCAGEHALSVTDLEAAAGCPFRFFLKRGLGLRPLDEDERDKDVWLESGLRGTELHALYAALHRRCRAAGRRPDMKKDAAWLRGLAQAALDRLRREMPPASDEVLDRESREFLADVELFLEGECAASGSEPIAFEVTFGRPLGEEEDDLASECPVDVDLGDGLTFRIAGRIDRIDRIRSGEFQILDYKTGSYYAPAWKGTFSGGRKLQHALYGRAAAELLRAREKKARVTGAVYYFPSRKGGRERVLIAAPAQAEIAKVLGDLRDVILKGAFIHATDKEPCKFCDFEAACGGQAHERAIAKLSDGKLQSYVRLTSHA